MNKNTVKYICNLSAFIIIALMLSYIEHLFPIGALIPVPGIKLGLSNILTLYLVTRKKFKDSFILAFSKALFSFFLFGNGISFLLSLSGNILSVISSILFLFILNKGFSVISLSVISAAFFNIGQICASAVFYGTAVFYYLPVLLFSSLFTGALTGYVGHISFKRVDMIINKRKGTDNKI